MFDNVPNDCPKTLAICPEYIHIRFHCWPFEFTKKQYLLKFVSRGSWSELWLLKLLLFTKTDESIFYTRHTYSQANTSRAIRIYYRDYRQAVYQEPYKDFVRVASTQHSHANAHFFMLARQASRWPEPLSVNLFAARQTFFHLQLHLRRKISLLAVLKHLSLQNGTEIN